MPGKLGELQPFKDSCFQIFSKVRSVLASEAKRHRLYRLESECQYQGQLLLCFKDGHLINNDGLLFSGPWEITDLHLRARWENVGEPCKIEKALEDCDKPINAACRRLDGSPWCFPACKQPCACKP